MNIYHDQNIIFKCLECLQGRGERVNELREIKALLETKFSECQQSIKNFEKDILTKVDQKIDDRINNINTNQNSIQEELTEPRCYSRSLIFMLSLLSLICNINKLF